MTTNIMKTLVYTVAHMHLRYLDEISPTCIAFEGHLKKLTRQSLWDKAAVYEYYTKDDIESESDRLAMEDMWANYIECEIASYDDEWKMN